MSRLTRILLLVAVALCLGAPTAGAVPAKKLDNNLAALWTTVLETPSAQNPFGTGGPHSRAGTSVARLRRSGPARQSCTVKPGTKIFVAASSVECSTFEGKGPTEKRNYGRVPARGRASSAHRDRRRQVRAGDRGRDTLLNITLPADNIFGLPAGTTGQSVAHGWVTLLDPLTPGTHTIVIVNGETTITTTIVVQPGH